jgi:hypothetical protein
VNKPIKPDKIAEAKLQYFPEIIFETFNKLIAENYSNGSAIIYEEDIVDRLIVSGITSDEIYDRGYLNVEEVYRVEGWKVIYKKPVYDDDYAASFTFKG